MEKRLNVAQDKLLHEKRKVSEIYLEVGFKNIFHFSTKVEMTMSTPNVYSLTVEVGIRIAGYWLIDF